MIDLKWFAAGTVAAILLALIALNRRMARRLNSMSKFAMTLLIDEFSYRQQRLRFLNLIETTKSDSALALYLSMMLNLEEASEKVAQTKLISVRMWQINQRALHTGQLISDSQETEAGIYEDLRGREFNPFPNREQITGVSDGMAKILIFKIKFAHRLRNFFGTSK